MGIRDGWRDTVDRLAARVARGSAAAQSTAAIASTMIGTLEGEGP
jgi:hypothetical protein